MYVWTYIYISLLLNTYIDKGDTHPYIPIGTTFVIHFKFVFGPLKTLDLKNRFLKIGFQQTFERIHCTGEIVFFKWKICQGEIVF